MWGGGGAVQRAQAATCSRPSAKECARTRPPTPAASLFRELDYRHEAANGTRFKELYSHLEASERVPEGALGRGRVCALAHQCRKRAHAQTVHAPLQPALQGVFVPGMYEDLTTRRVLVMEWVEGERLRTAYAARTSGEVRGGRQ